MSAIENMKLMLKEVSSTKKSIIEKQPKWDTDILRLGLKALVSTEYTRAVDELEKTYRYLNSQEFTTFINDQVSNRHLRVLGYFFCAAAAVEIRNLGKKIFDDKAARYYAKMASKLLGNIELEKENETNLEFPLTGTTSSSGTSSSWNDIQELINKIFSLVKEEDRDEYKKEDLQISEAKAFTSYLLTAEEEYTRKEKERCLRWREYPVLFIMGDNGLYGTIRVEMLRDGHGDFYSKPQKMFFLTARSNFLDSIETAWKYAGKKSPEGIKNIDIVWDIWTETLREVIFSDRSAGAPMALAVQQLLLNEPLPEDYRTVITGEVDEDGNISKVGGIVEKIEVGLRHSVRIIMLHPENRKKLVRKLKRGRRARYGDLLHEIDSKIGGLDNVKAVETIDEAAEYASGLPKEVKRYLEFVGQESEELNILKRLGKQINLKDIYISVKTTKWEKRDYQEERRREMERIKGKWEEEKDLIFKDPRIPRGGDREKKGEEKAKVFQWKDERKKYRKCAFLGDPGAGKSTLLRWESCHVVEDGLKTIEKGERYSDIEIPMFIRLAEISSSLMENRKDGNVPDLLNVHINSKLKPVFQDDGFSKFIKNQAKEGKVCFLLDALDEVPDGERKVLDESLKNLEICYKKCRFLLTSRIVGYSGCPFNLAGKIEDYTLTLVPFGWKETERFVKSWFHGSALAKKGKNFLNELKKNREMKGLSQNPLLLTLLCALYEEESGDGKGDGKIPVKKSQLYDKCINNFLTIWKSTKDKAETDHKLKLDAKRILYADMAFHFFSQGKEFFPEQETLNFIKFHDRVKEFAGSPTFDEESITDWKRFLISLKDSDNKHTVFVYSKLSKEERNLIDEWNADCKIDEDLITDITIGLNRILLDKRFYKNELFRDLEIFQEAQSTSEKKGANLRSKEIQLLNRNTIESIFPNLIQNLYIDEILSDGILVPAGYDKSGVAKFMFLHRTFQEYLTACALSEDPLSEPVERPSITAKKNKPTVKLTGIDFIESQLWDFEWWEEVILLMSSRFGDESGKTDGYNNGVGGHNKAEDLVKMLL
ncbi:MAG: hypothetical protein K8T10_10515, partial [Candidatus Eremiobacteraeota bacterium]|nr:hypothetical protein [Candidatus Eremiobacteraeota bacterium]